MGNCTQEAGSEQKQDVKGRLKWMKQRSPTWLCLKVRCATTRLRADLLARRFWLALPNFLRCLATWQHNAKFIETVHPAEIPSIFNNRWPCEARPDRYVWSSRHSSSWVFVAHLCQKPVCDASELALARHFSDEASPIETAAIRRRKCHADPALRVFMVTVDIISLHSQVFTPVC